MDPLQRQLVLPGELKPDTVFAELLAYISSKAVNVELPEVEKLANGLGSNMHNITLDNNTTKTYNSYRKFELMYRIIKTLKKKKLPLLQQENNLQLVLAKIFDIKKENIGNLIFYTVLSINLNHSLPATFKKVQRFCK